MKPNAESATVLVDGTPVVSCVFPAFKANGARVETIENLVERDDELHPFAAGIPGSRCGAVWHLHAGRDHDGESADRREKSALASTLTESTSPSHLKDTFCRCTGYQSITRAILQASGQDVPPAPSRRLSRRSIRSASQCPTFRRRDKITGAARFTDDYRFPGMLLCTHETSTAFHTLEESARLTHPQHAHLPGVQRCTDSRRHSGQESARCVHHGLAGIVRRQSSLRRRCNRDRRRRHRRSSRSRWDLIEVDLRGTTRRQRRDRSGET